MFVNGRMSSASRSGQGSDIDCILSHNWLSDDVGWASGFFVYASMQVYSVSFEYMVNLES